MILPLTFALRRSRRIACLLRARRRSPFLITFMSRCSTVSSSHLMEVQSPSPTTWIALCHRQEEHLLAHGGMPLPQVVSPISRSARSLLVNDSCVNSTSAKPRLSLRLLVPYVSILYIIDNRPHPTESGQSKKALLSKLTTRTGSLPPHLRSDTPVSQRVGA